LVLNVTSTEPGVITGPNVTCGLTTASYSIAAVTGSAGYTWTVPSGGTISAGGQGTTGITVTFSTPMSGNVSVISTNGCANSVARTLAVSKYEPTPGVITGPTNVCGTTSETYSIAAEAGATNYVWAIVQAVPVVMTISSGSTTTSMIAIQPGTTMNAATVKVAAVNACGTSAASSLAVAACASSIGMNGTVVDVTTDNYSEIYPNPATQEFTIDVTTDVDKNIVVEVYDVLGNKLVSENHFIANGVVNTMKTNIETFKNGMYFVRLLDVNGNVLNTQRIIKQ
jgi:hypothetical protein